MSSWESLDISPGKLVQSFNPYRNDYTAMSSATRVTVTPVSEHDAVIEFLDRNRRPIADADTSLEGHQIDLSPGVTAIRVKVTSNDDLSINTYTVAVSRAPALRHQRGPHRETVNSRSPGPHPMRRAVPT